MDGYRQVKERGVVNKAGGCSRRPPRCLPRATPLSRPGSVVRGAAGRSPRVARERAAALRGPAAGDLSGGGRPPRCGRTRKKTLCGFLTWRVPTNGWHRSPTLTAADGGSMPGPARPCQAPISQTPNNNQ
eukprot:scaffold17675_cov107-Isochrysis_galbana.AAC.1